MAQTFRRTYGRGKIRHAFKTRSKATLLKLQTKTTVAPFLYRSENGTAVRQHDRNIGLRETEELDVGCRMCCIKCPYRKLNRQEN